MAKGCAIKANKEDFIKRVAPGVRVAAGPTAPTMVPEHEAGSTKATDDRPPFTSFLSSIPSFITI